ncbi:MAG TPA: ABC transporter permease [Myxococcales bacterium]|nr:ABC transporter permease [Myxococcales bacterium]
MTPLAHGALHSAWVEGAGFITETSAVAEAELRKIARDPTELFSRSVQPILWLLVFGQVFSRLHAVPTGALSYEEFIAPGILAQSVLFTAIFYGIAIIWERDLGIVHKMLVSPALRLSLVAGKAVAAGLRALAPSLVIYAVALALGLRLRFAPLQALGVLAAVFLGSATFATFSLIVACLVKTRERFMGIGQVITMPLFFASNAIYPIEAMPAWLKAVSHGNPLTYLVDVLRALMLQGGESAFGLGTDFGVLLLVTAVLLAVASRLYPTVVL